MGLFGESKQDIINRYERLMKDKQLQIERMEHEIATLRSNNQLLTEDIEKVKNTVIEKDKELEVLKQDNDEYNNIVLCSGKYKGGENIPAGIYDLKILSGTGIVQTQKPNKEFFRLESNEKIRKKRNWSDKYSGLVVTDETIVEITESAKISFQFAKPISYSDEYNKYIQKRDEVKQEIEYLQKIRDSEKVKVGDVFILGAGTYYGGKTIPIGIYNLKAISDSSMVETDKPQVYFNIGKNSEYFEEKYVGLEVQEGTILKINNKCKIEFFLTIKLDSQDEINKKNQELREIEEQINSAKEELNNIGKTIQNKEHENGIVVLQAGKYRGGRDIPIGEYDLVIMSGYGMVETNRPENMWFWMSADAEQRERQNYTEQYNGLDISEKTILKISQNATIKFVKKAEYNYEHEKQELNEEYRKKKQELDYEYSQKHEEYLEKFNKMQSELCSIKSEIKILNDKSVEKYYRLSDYDGITSQDCKNKLFLLKSEEKALRESEEDIKILDSSEKKKLIERSIRQILRNFNADCDNQIMNISIKNIDVVRNRIHKSFDTLNKLYSVDGIALTDKILALKLEQATLLYTYELKYQQEKDIQQAIKEQMIEEAKAEREIQEQKKKIEKDLQQHLGEVNRLMKYLQKAQIDAERQLYMDKINELEAKIKALEADKETVLERETNAKAGFVYIISNIGSFGDGIYKIGMTRRLEPMDRVRELSSASVPFEFDVHAMIFSSDAPELETTLHRYFADRAVNKINPRKEFYRVGIDEIEKIVKENYNDTVQFTKIPVATEYRQSLELEMRVLQNHQPR